MILIVVQFGQLLEKFLLIKINFVRAVLATSVVSIYIRNKKEGKKTVLHDIIEIVSFYYDTSLTSVKS